MSDQLLTVLKLCLLALLYLFFLRVLWAVWSEVRLPKPARARSGGASPARPITPPPSGHRGNGKRADSKAKRRGRASADSRQRRLAVVSPDEQAGLEFDLSDELTIGRAAGCQITLDDSFVSQLHARVFRREGQYMVEDIGSTNGTYVNKKKVTSPVMLRPGDHLQIGSVVMELT